MRLTALNCAEINVSGLNKSAESSGSVLFVSGCPSCFVPLVALKRDSSHGCCAVSFNKYTLIDYTLFKVHFAQLL